MSKKHLDPPRIESWALWRKPFYLALKIFINIFEILESGKIPIYHLGGSIRAEKIFRNLPRNNKWESEADIRFHAHNLIIVPRLAWRVFALHNQAITIIIYAIALEIGVQ